MLLRCEDCGALCDYGEGWIARLIDDDEEPGQASYVVHYCPACAAREFDFVPKQGIARIARDAS